jgi:hypothetical protein
MCLDAAYFGDLELLKWLHESGCPWSAVDVATEAIRGERFQSKLILPWMLRTVDDFSHEERNQLLFDAGVVRNVAAVTLMLEAGAEWPSSFVGKYKVRGEPVRACWGHEAVAWALNKGRSWGVWRCQDLAPELYTNSQSKCRAVDLFKWAHENGCPCTCEAATADGAAAVGGA